MRAMLQRRYTLALVLMSVLGCDDTSSTSLESKPQQGSTSPAKQTPVDGSSRPMLLVFSRDYCAPCQVMKPWVEELSAETRGVDVVTVNVDRKAHEHIGAFFKISAVPTLIYLQGDGVIARRTDGLAKKAQMIAVLQELGWQR